MILLFPRDFVPEEHGWQVANPIVPHQRYQAAMMELHRFGFVSTHFLRWQIPFRFPAALVLMGYKSESGRYWGMYNPPFAYDETKVTRAQVVEEILWGVASPERPFVSLRGK